MRPETLGRWLYGVARRVALRARSAARQRRGLAAHAACRTPADPARAAELADLRDVVADELEGLPEKYRMAVELCHLQGLTHEEAASRLGWPVGTVRSRLSRGRDGLRLRLTRRGLAPAAALGALGEDPRGAVPGSLVDSTARAATITAAGGAGAFPASVAALARGGVWTMTLGKFKAAAVAAALGLGVAGTGVFAFQDAGSSDPGREKPQAVGAATPGVGPLARPDPRERSETTPAESILAADARSKEIQDLAAAVRERLVHLRVEEARALSRRLARLAAEWEASLVEQARDEPGTRQPGSSGRAPEGPSPKPYPPVANGRSARPAHENAPESRDLPAGETPPLTDQDRRIRRLENLVEELLRERRQAGENREKPLSSGPAGSAGS